MSEQTAQEPTMEEILASIRRIISEDDAPAEAAPAATPPAAVQAAPAPAPAPVAPTPEPEPEPAPTAAAGGEEEVLELTDRVEETPMAAASETLGDLDVYTPSAAPAPAPAPAPSFAAAPQRAAAPAETHYADGEGLLSGAAADRAASAFGALARDLKLPKEGRTMEDLVSELIRPMLTDWLQQHLAEMVQAEVRAEVERIARRQVG